MNRIQRLAVALGILAALSPVFAQSGTARPDKSRKAAPHASEAQMARGQKVFEQNCSRCHNAPQSFPPQITATIVRHMRVRASLSAADEKALLRFIKQ